MRNGVFDEESNSSTRMRLRSIILEEGVTRESETSRGRKVSVRQIMSGLSVATCMERSVRFE